MSFSSCFECGGRCCLGFGVPVEYAFDMYTTGVPIALYVSELDGQPARYLTLHAGVTVDPTGSTFTVSRDIGTSQEPGCIAVHSRCLMLNERGLCIIYPNRPDMCRNFTKETAHRFQVPEGCKYETSQEKGM